MIYKNTADQKLAVYAYTVADGAAKTGDAGNITCYVSKDWGGAGAVTDTNPTELDATNMKGWYVFDLAQAETNAEVLIFSPVSATSGVVLDQVQVFTQDAAISSRAAASTALDKTTWTDARAGYLDKAQYLPAVTAGNAGGVFIAGTNAATTVTTALTTTFTGSVTGSVASVTGDVGGKVIGGGIGTITGVGAWVAGAAGAAVALEGSITTVLARLGAWTGTTTNNILGALRSLMNKAIAAPADITSGGSYDASTDSLEGIRDTAPLGTAMRGTDNAVLATTVGAAGAGLTALGDTRLANLDAAISTRSVYAGGAVASVTGAVGSVAGLNAANLDVAVSTRAATGEAAAAVGTLNDFNPASDVVASVTTVGTVTNPVTAGTVSDKTGYALAATGLDSITATTPTGVATTFPQKLVQLWHRFFGKVTMTATQLKTYDDAGTGVLTTQTTSDDGTTQTQGKAT